MSRELKRIQRLRDLRSHRERAAEKELAVARRGVVEAEAALEASRSTYDEAIASVASVRDVAAPDFELERLRVVSLGRAVERAERGVEAAQTQHRVRKDELTRAHREVEQMDRWAEMTRTAARADEQRLDRFESDETAARARSRT